MSKQLNDEQFREMIVRQLKTGNVNINFTKIDGTFRDILCTLTNIPEDKQPQAKEPGKESKYTIKALRVFDVEKQDWRSFRLDSVNSVTPI